MSGESRDMQAFGKAVGRAVHALGIADELIAEVRAELGKGGGESRRSISEIRRAAGAKGKETRKARAAAGGAY